MEKLGEANAMITKSIRLTEEEAAELRSFVAVTGEVEASALKKAALRGLYEMRLEHGERAYLRGMTSGQAAEAAGVPHVALLEALMDRGVKLLDGPSTLPEELRYLAKALHVAKLEAVAERLAGGEC